MGNVGAIVIARWSWTLMRDTAVVLLDKANAALAIEVRQAIEKPGDLAAVGLHVCRVGPKASAGIVSVENWLLRLPSIGARESSTQPLRVIWRWKFVERDPFYSKLLRAGLIVTCFLPRSSLLSGSVCRRLRWVCSPTISLAATRERFSGRRGQSK